MALLPIVHNFLLILLFFTAIVDISFGVRCNRYPKNVLRKTRSSGDGGYRVLIAGEPDGYQPGKIYNGKSNEILFHVPQLRTIVF